MTEAVIQDWKVEENTQFAAGDTIAEIETEKAVVDFEADAAGVVLRFLASPGATIDVGAPIAVIGEVGEIAADVDAFLASLGVISSLLSAPAVSPDETVTAVGAAQPIEAAALGTPAVVPAINVENHSDGRTFASPLARKMARDAGLELAQLAGTGPGGRVIRADVELVLARRTVAEPAPKRAPVSGSSYTDVAHNRLRRMIAQRLTESKQQVPHFYLRRTARVDALLDLRSQLNAAGQVKISINDLVIKSAALAHRRLPAMNVIWTDDALRQFYDVDVSVAIAGEKGLVTPVIRSADRLSISELSLQVKDFVARAGSGRLRQQELEGGSFAVTNLGMFGVEDFAAIINPPQSAILAVGRVERVPVVNGAAVEIGAVMQLTLSVDHRAVDGALAAEWFGIFIGILEAPLQVLL